jgi:hypothetical protein
VRRKNTFSYCTYCLFFFFKIITDYSDGRKTDFFFLRYYFFSIYIHIHLPTRLDKIKKVKLGREKKLIIEMGEYIEIFFLLVSDFTMFA